VSDDFILETENLTKEFAGFVAVNGINLRVARGTIHALIGPNGAGKTTCFNLLTKFMRPTRGRIVYKGRDITTLPPADVAVCRSTRPAASVTVNDDGTWSYEEHTAIRDLCDKFKLKLDQHQYSFSFWNGRKRSRLYLPGKMKFSAKAQRQFDSYGKQFAKLDSAQQRFLDQFDWWSVLRSLGFTPDDLVKRDLMDSTDFGESIRLTSAYAAAAEYFESNPTDEMDFKIRGGNVRVLSKVPFWVEQRMGPAPLFPTVCSIMAQWLDAGGRYIGVLCEIPLRVKERMR